MPEMDRLVESRICSRENGLGALQIGFGKLAVSDRSLVGSRRLPEVAKALTRELENRTGSDRDSERYFFRLTGTF